MKPEVVGVLTLADANTSIPVFSGDSEIAMTLGAGHLTDTSPLTGTGNIAITAHRDGTFRLLKDVEIGARLSLTAEGATRNFIVKRRFVVEPEQVDVLEPTETTTLTLITCYPFYFVGKAPRRYIVQAEEVAD